MKSEDNFMMTMQSCQPFKLVLFRLILKLDLYVRFRFESKILKIFFFSKIQTALLKY